MLTTQSLLNNEQLTPPKPKLLIVEDNAELRTQLKCALDGEYEVSVAENRREALELVRRNRPRVVTLDFGLPPYSKEATEGFETLTEILKEEASTKVIVMTGHEERVHAIKAIGQGAYDFLSKPIQLQELQVVLRRTFQLSRIEQETRALERNSSAEGFEGILGSSPKMQAVYATIRKVAPTDASVLIVGESGTGKELVARSIHQQSERRASPFFTINCGAMPENLLERELFGHEKGSFTGAHAQRKGRIEMAHGGTLFLDEVGELSLPLQVKLLRFLQEHLIERIGGREQIAVDVMVLAATNMDLWQAMKEGRFREDLYYRLSVVIISLPPLRERGADIFGLAQVMLQKSAVLEKKNITGFTPEALRALETHSWPGNVRELQNRIKRAVIMADGPNLTPGDLELTGFYAKPEESVLREARESLERDLIEVVLAKNKGNLRRTAIELSISRSGLYERIQKLGIRLKTRSRDKTIPPSSPRTR